MCQQWFGTHYWTIYMYSMSCRFYMYDTLAFLTGSRPGIKMEWEGGSSGYDSFAMMSIQIMQRMINASPVNFYDHSSREVGKQLQPDRSELRRITCNENCTNLNSVTWLLEINGWITSHGNGPMDSVQVGKAVFVKISYTILGIEPSTFS